MDERHCSCCGLRFHRGICAYCDRPGSDGHVCARNGRVVGARHDCEQGYETAALAPDYELRVRFPELACLIECE
jgi:hypothetical protein